ncbi:MAG TPA: DMT family transporter [Xanthobacteraceae bacterium]|nr:DMT family transporter [Xanthobacteraceae bacterium]
MTTAQTVPSASSDAIRIQAPDTPSSNVQRGIVCMIIATVAFAITHALSKWLVGSYPVGQVMFSRSLVGFVGCTAVLLPLHGTSVFATRMPAAHWVRGLSQSISQTFSVLAFSLMPLASAIAINFSAPLWTALVAIIWLKERAGPARWVALFAGFSGVLIVANPGLDSFTLGASFALLNAIMLGTVTVAVRGMTRTESVNTLLIWQLATVLLFHSLLLVFGFKWPTLRDLSLFVMCGLANLVGQVFWTKALMLAPATAVSPFFYFMLVWAAAIGFFVWGSVPTTALMAGSCIVVASGLFLLWHEAQAKKSVRTA